MKFVRCLGVPALLLLAGCFPTALGLNEPQPPAPVPVVQKPRPVTPERVNGGNAKQMADALANELDRVESQP